MTKQIDPSTQSDLAPEASSPSALERWSRPAAIVGAGVGAVLAPVANAATFTVTNLNDAGAGSLRQAVADANAAGGADIVAFQAGLTGTITLTTGQIAISDSVTISGPGAATLTVSGNNASRVFYLYNGAATDNVTISGLTITGGAGVTFGGGIIDFGENLTLDSVVMQGNSATAGGGAVAATDLSGAGMQFQVLNSTLTGNTSGRDGGAIYFYNTGGPMLVRNSVISGNSTVDDGGGIYLYDIRGGLTIEDSTISGNTGGNGAGAFGGGVYHYDADATVTVSRTTLNGNSATYGGGWASYLANSPVVFENATISGNTAGALGGGVFVLYSDDSATIRHSTVSGNTAGSLGGGVITYYGTSALDQVIVADNTVGGVGDDVATGQTGAFDARFSLIEASTGTINDGGGNVVGQDPLLGPLADNGGPTQTQLPGAGSPAIDAGDPAFAPPPSVDQRGQPRVAGGRIDIGAVEVPAGVPGQLDIDSIAVDETAGTATLTVTRTGGSSGAISVSYATADGSATAPSDYATTGGTLNWANGDATPRSVVVPIVSDAIPEPAETFTVTLSGPQGGATLGSATGTVTINANLGGPGTSFVANVPTTSDWARGLLAGVLALFGLRWLRRRNRGAAAILVVAGLAGAALPDAAHAARAPEVTEGRVASVARSGNSYELRFADGRVVTVDAAKLEFNDRRMRGPRVDSLDAVTADTMLRVRVRRDDNGNVRRVRVAAINGSRS